MIKYALRKPNGLFYGANIDDCTTTRTATRFGDCTEQLEKKFLEVYHSNPSWELVEHNP